MNINRNNQVTEFAALWHRIIDLDSGFGLDKLFPNFHELSTTEISIIQIISEEKDVLLKDISQKLHLPKSTLTNTINRLEKKDYLHRIISKHDLRSYSLELTSRGLQAQKEHIEYETLIFTGILQALNSDEERSELIRLLNIITNNLEKDK